MNVPDIMEQRSLLERLARHLAAGATHNWPYWVEDAASILAMLKEPDPAMRETGDVTAWQAMIDTALQQRWTIFPPAMTGADEDHAGSADEEGEIRLSPEAIDQDAAKWVHLHSASKETP